MNHRNQSVIGPFGGSASRVTAPDAAISAELAFEMDDYDVVKSNCTALGAAAVPDTLSADLMSYISDDVVTLDRDLPREREGIRGRLNTDETEYFEDDGIVDEWERGGSKNISMADVGKKGIEFVDRAIVPIKHEITYEDARKNIFVKGKKLLTDASKLQFHYANTLCLAYLDSFEESILHVIRGWTQREILEDIGYRFMARRTM